MAVKTPQRHGGSTVIMTRTVGLPAESSPGWLVPPIRDMPHVGGVLDAAVRRLLGDRRAMSVPAVVRCRISVPDQTAWPRPGDGVGEGLRTGQPQACNTFAATSPAAKRSGPLVGSCFDTGHHLNC